MKTRDEALKYALSFPDTYQDAPFHDENWQLVRFKGNKKVFLWTYERDEYINLNVKVDTAKAFFWRNIYRSVIPGYHQNKDHWNTIILDGSIPDKDVKLMIAESYDLVCDSPTKRIYEAVKRIPRGCVATYAQVAEEAGDKKMARAVGNALHKNPDPLSIPCHRVVNAKGELAGEYAFGGAWKQAQRLIEEGVKVSDGKVDLLKYRWDNRDLKNIVSRINKMESVFDKADSLLNGSRTDIDELMAYQPKIKELETYYESRQWRYDLEADEKGLLPKDLKRGILSEDGIYNLLERNNKILKEKGN